jgi:tetratricopeptide (TPR) repeat protein
MLEPKRIPKSAVPAALEKALRYRLLNEPLEAESICRDVLVADPGNQEALVTLLLALTDQFDREVADALELAKQVLPQLSSEYEREYYAGIIHERWAKAQLARGVPGDAVSGWFREALHCYERATAISPPDDPDAILRWNTCVRILQRNEHLRPADQTMSRDLVRDFGDEVPRL